MKLINPYSVQITFETDGTFTVSEPAQGMVDEIVLSKRDNVQDALADLFVHVVQTAVLFNVVEGKNE